jgi:hypothetical protein
MPYGAAAARWILIAAAVGGGHSAAAASDISPVHNAHYVSVYGVADARSSLPGSGYGWFQFVCGSVVRGAARCVARQSLVTDDTFSLCGPWYW